MFKHWNRIEGRLRQRDADGRFLTAVTGEESVEELREIAEQMTYFCPAAHAAVGCPFDRLSKLTDQSLHSALAHMSREDLLELFEMERECRSRVLEKVN
jgi:epoxyqueuosine reductase QueG